MSSGVSSASSREPTVFSADPGKRRPSCSSHGPASPPTAPLGPAPPPPTYSLANLRPEQIGWNLQTSSLGLSAITSSSTAPPPHQPPLDRYLSVPQGNELIALGIPTGTFTGLPPHNQELPPLRNLQRPPPQASQPEGGNSATFDRSEEIRFLTSFAGGAFSLPASSRRSKDLEIELSSGDDSTPTAASGDDEDEELMELDAQRLRQLVAERKMRRDREHPRATKLARKRRRDKTSTRTQAGSPKRTSVTESPGKKKGFETDTAGEE